MDVPKRDSDSWSSNLSASLWSALSGNSNLATKSQPAPGMSAASHAESQISNDQATRVASAPSPALKSIKIPIASHRAASHPELAFSPTDIGIWEVERGSPRKSGDRNPSEGFTSWGSWFGGNQK